MGLFDRIGMFPIAPPAFGDLFPIDGHVPRSLDANAHLGAIHGHDRDFDVIADSQSFTRHDSARVLQRRV